MSNSIADYIDLELAWKRVKFDISNRIFIRNPFEVILIESSIDQYLENLHQNLDKNHWHPASNYICNVPKNNNHIRPGANLSIDDSIVYNALIGSALSKFNSTLEWARGVKDFSYQINQDFKHTKLFTDRFKGWDDFRVKSLQKIDDGANYVVIADITGYYENVDISTLISDLRSINVKDQIINLFSMCLNRWANSNARGIPQGYSASDLLGKLYLNTIDLNLSAMGFDHFRYVDDFRIFCNDLPEAKTAIVKLTELLRKRGLNLQSAKSGIYSKEEAKKNIDGIQPILQPLIKRFIDDLTVTYDISNPYFSVADADELLKGFSEEVPLEVLQTAYNKYFVKSKSFDKTLYRFLLNRMGSSKDDFALKYSISLLAEHPEETETILRYIKSLRAYSKIESELINFLNSDISIYPYQLYQIFDWLLDHHDQISETMISIIRNISFDNSQPNYLRVVCRKILGNMGNSADLERLEQYYSNIDDEKEKSEIICCLTKMERTRRNSFLSRVQHDGNLISIACNLVRQNKI